MIYRKPRDQPHLVFRPAYPAPCDTECKASKLALACKPAIKQTNWQASKQASKRAGKPYVMPYAHGFTHQIVAVQSSKRLSALPSNAAVLQQLRQLLDLEPLRLWQQLLYVSDQLLSAPAMRKLAQVDMVAGLQHAFRGALRPAPPAVLLLSCVDILDGLHKAELAQRLRMCWLFTERRSCVLGQKHVGSTVEPRHVPAAEQAGLGSSASAVSCICSRVPRLCQGCRCICIC